MRLFQGLTYEQVQDLPAGFSEMALAFDAAEKEVKAEAEKEATKDARNHGGQVPRRA